MINVFDELKGFKDRYTKNIINKLYVGHPDLQEEIETKIRVAKTNKENDTANKLLKKCKLPDSNNHLIKNGFDPEILFE